MAKFLWNMDGIWQWCQYIMLRMLNLFREISVKNKSIPYLPAIEEWGSFRQKGFTHLNRMKEWLTQVTAAPSFLSFKVCSSDWRGDGWIFLYEFQLKYWRGPDQTLIMKRILISNHPNLLIDSILISWDPI